MLPRAMYTFNAIPVLIPWAFYTQLEQTISVESEKTPNCQGNIEKENRTWGHHNAGSQAVLQSCDHQDSVVLVQKQTHRSMENPEMSTQLYGQLIFDKAGKIIHWKKGQSLQ